MHSSDHTNAMTTPPPPCTHLVAVLDAHKRALQPREHAGPELAVHGVVVHEQHVEADADARLHKNHKCHVCEA